MRNLIRIESHENIVRDAKIIWIGDEGEETDISRCVQSVMVDFKVGEVSRAQLGLILVDADLTAQVDELIVRRYVPRKRRFWHRWLQRDPIEVTAYGARAREYVAHNPEMKHSPE